MHPAFDAPVARAYLAPARATVAALLLAGCASHNQPDFGPPAPLIAGRLAEATTPANPLLLRFDWSLAEQEARFSGAGVARIEGERARIDLFGPRGESVLAAVVYRGELRLPPGVPDDAPVPPPALLWAALGVFRVPTGAELTGTSTLARTTDLRYTLPGETWYFRFTGDRLTRAERETRRTRQLLELGEAVEGLPATAAFRDFGAYRELRLSFTEAENVLEGFSPEIWTDL